MWRRISDSTFPYNTVPTIPICIWTLFSLLIWRVAYIKVDSLKMRSYLMKVIFLFVQFRIYSCILIGLLLVRSLEFLVNWVDNLLSIVSCDKARMINDGRWFDTTSILGEKNYFIRSVVRKTEFRVTIFRTIIDQYFRIAYIDQGLHNSWSTKLQPVYLSLQIYME